MRLSRGTASAAALSLLQEKQFEAALEELHRQDVEMVEVSSSFETGLPLCLAEFNSLWPPACWP